MTLGKLLTPSCLDTDSLYYYILPLNRVRLPLRILQWITFFTEQWETFVLTTVADGMSVDEKSCGTCKAEDTDGQAAQDSIVHLLMIPNKEPVKIGNFIVLWNVI